MKSVIRLLLVGLAAFPLSVFAQQKDSAVKKTTDTLVVNNDSGQVTMKTTQAQDTAAVKSKKKPFDPHKATLYSAILPGAGQVYNRKYWKLPLVYAAIGIPGYYYFFNRTWYRKCEYALAVTVNGSTGDSLARVDPDLLPLVRAYGVTQIKSARDYYRKNEDYCVLFFALFWGLQIVDATVDAHLKGFNVSDDLSFRIRPTLLASPYSLVGVNIAVNIHAPKRKLIDLNN